MSRIPTDPRSPLLFTRSTIEGESRCSTTSRRHQRGIYQHARCQQLLHQSHPSQLLSTSCGCQEILGPRLLSRHVRVVHLLALHAAQERLSGEARTDHPRVRAPVIQSPFGPLLCLLCLLHVGSCNVFDAREKPATRKPTHSRLTGCSRKMRSFVRSLSVCVGGRKHRHYRGNSKKVWCFSRFSRDALDARPTSPASHVM